MEEATSSQRGDLVHINWKGKRKPLLLRSTDSWELVEVLGVLLKQHNQNRIQQVRRLKQIWIDRKTAYDSSNPEHEEVLMRYWSTVFPDKPIEERISSDWGRIGFQGKVTSTYTDVQRPLTALKGPGH